ncbi:hypothetical protein TIMSHEL_53 [Mycobacterium phage Timshel]|uniref:Uncharacterized protein n=1 Tax=Mycobacterium phage Timshel TaxID=1032895 RepID=G1DB71_9CAUD|nr:hypothetical protein FDI10_gp41 [Mycobacterium phage Timshel]AEJ92380.1 hypothetical protein TIMSHEL_53 [Mycobacterium phage Timshel]
MSYKTGDVAVVTGPLRLASGSPWVYFAEGDVVDIVRGEDEDGDVLAVRRSDGLDQYIVGTSLTPFSTVAEDPEIDWGQVHDYVYQEGDDDA